MEILRRGFQMITTPRQTWLSALLLFGVAALTVCFVGIGLLAAARRASNAFRIPPTASLVTQIQTLNEWVTVKYIVEKVVKLESEPSLLGQDRVILLAHAVVKAGIDLTQLQPGDVQVASKRITISLPNSKIVDCYLDEKRTEVWEHKTAFWRPMDSGLEQSARRQALEQIRMAAAEQGIQKEATERAHAQLSLLLRNLGFESVSFHP
jgi:Protein of unknown function (DUF4230)